MSMNPVHSPKVEIFIPLESCVANLSTNGLIPVEAREVRKNSERFFN